MYKQNKHSVYTTKYQNIYAEVYGLLKAQSRPVDDAAVFKGR
jgi:hypothetical protein